MPRQTDKSIYSNREGSTNREDRKGKTRSLSRDRDREKRKHSTNRRRSRSPSSHSRRYVDKSPESQRKCYKSKRHRSHSKYKKSKSRRNRSSSESSNSNDSDNSPNSSDGYKNDKKNKLELAATHTKSVKYESINSLHSVIDHETIKQIEEQSFVPQTFQATIKKITEKVIIDLNNETVSVSGVNTCNSEDDCIFHSNFLGNETQRLGKWAKKLLNYRQKFFVE